MQRCPNDEFILTGVLSEWSFQSQLSPAPPHGSAAVACRIGMVTLFCSPLRCIGPRPSSRAVRSVARERQEHPNSRPPNSYPWIGATHPLVALVARGGSNDALRAHTALQCKAALRRHNALRQAAPTRQCGAVYAPFGRAAKRPSAALRSLELARLVRRSRALHLDASRSAERVITSAASH